MSKSKRMHEVVESGLKYRTKNGDAKKKDESDPQAYIKLNPKAVQKSMKNQVIGVFK